MTKLQRWSIAGILAAVVAAWGWLPAGADSGPATSNGGAPATQPATAPSSDQVMQGMEKLIEKNPAIEPSYRHDTPKRDSTTINPAVLGTAPGEQPVKLRREGEFIVGRLGHLTHGTGTQFLFVFDADSQNAPEAPMILLPCETLQSMEDLVQERGDRVVFKLSGQILTYRGANYLLPTTMILERDKGNLGR